MHSNSDIQNVTNFYILNTMLIWCPGLSDASTFKCKLQNLEGLQAKWATVGICFMGPTFWCYKSQPSYFQNQKSEWWSWSWCSKGLSKGYKKLLGCVQYLTSFFSNTRGVVKQLKKKFCICFPIMMKLMTLLLNKNFTTLGSHDPRQWMKIPRSKLQWALISSHLALYFASTPNFKTSALSWGKDMLCCDRPCYGFTCGWISDTASLLKSPPLKLRAIYDWCVVQI